MQCTATTPITSRLRGPSCREREGEGCTLMAKGRAARWVLLPDKTPQAQRPKTPLEAEPELECCSWEPALQNRVTPQSATSLAGMVQKQQVGAVWA